MANGTSFLRPQKRRLSAQSIWRTGSEDKGRQCRALAFFLVLLLVAPITLAAEREYDLEIPSATADVALKSLSKQTGYSVIFQSDEVKSAYTKAVVGRYTVEIALGLLLKATNLSYGLTEDDVITITRSVPDKSIAGADTMPMSRTQKKTLFKRLAAAVTAMFVIPAGAQNEGVVTEDELTLEEVIVTATRRETGIQETAASIDAFSGSSLEELGKTNITQFLDAVPGVTAIDQGGGRNTIIFRNLATSTQESGSPTAAAYFDDFAISHPGRGLPVVRLVDMERIEVLKGPQGTLFGRSAMGGIIRYISNKPNSEAIEGGFNGYLSSTTDGGNNYGGHGYLNLPITEDLAVRFVAYTYQDDGFVDNVELGVPDFNDEDTKGGRIALHWAATDEFSLDLTYLTQSTDGALGWVSTTRDPGDLNIAGDEGPNIPFDIEARTQVAGTLNEYDPKYEALNLKLEYDFDSFTTTFLATRVNTELGWVFEEREYMDVYAGTAADLNGRGSDYYPGDKADTDVMELRLVSSSDGFFDWIAGVYYEDSKMKSLQYTPYTGPSGQDYYGLPMEAGVILIDLEIDRKSHEEALYGELGLNFTDDTRLLVGYRRSDVEYGDLVTRAIGTFDLWALWDTLQDIPFDSQADVNTYKVSLEHSFSEDVFGYALATSGYRRGGVNWPDPWSGAPMTTFDSDTLWNYELGLKSTWLGGRLVANVAAYLLDYDDIQLTIQEPVTYAYVTRNVGKAQVMGLEFGINYLATDYLTLGFAGSLSDPELKEDIPPFLNWDTGEFDIYTGRKGDKLPGSSTENFSFSANYDRPLSNGMGLFASAFYRYVGSRLNDFNLDLDVKLPSYSLTDLRLGISHPNGWSVALFADNVFDEAIIYQIDRMSSFESVPTNRPRTVGLNFIYNYR